MLSNASRQERESRRSVPKVRRTAELSDGLNKRLTSYGLAAEAAGQRSPMTTHDGPGLVSYGLAGAAGLGLLAMAVPAHADIIVTTVNAHFAFSAPGCASECGNGSGGAVALVTANLFHSKANGFQLWGFGMYNLDGGGVNLGFKGLGGAGVMSNATALPKGRPIGPRGAFRRSAFMVSAVGNYYYPSQGFIVGPWAGSSKSGRVADAFLGLRFYIDGQAHYGWAELSLLTLEGFGEASFSGELKAFAYDTLANQQILAGQTAVPEPSTLGLLALGSLGLSLWRKKKAA